MYDKEGEEEVMDWDAIKRAYDVVDSGVAKRLDLEGGIVVYSVGNNVVRIDVKKDVKK